MPIYVKEETKLFSLETRGMSYLFALDSRGLLRHLYWGKKISRMEDFILEEITEISSNDSWSDMTREEYTPWSGLRYKEPCLKAQFKDGTRDVVLEYQDYAVNGNLLTVTLKDSYYPLWVHLKYEILEERDILKRWVELENKGDDSILLESIQSAEFNLPGNGWALTNVGGHWGTEHQLFREILGPGKKVLESRKGSTSHNNNPYFVLEKDASEEQGEVFFGVLGYSGNFKITLEVTPYDTTRALAGINDWDFGWHLQGGETFITPPLWSGYMDGGFGSMSRTLHQLARSEIMPEAHRDTIRPVLYNSWEATGFDINITDQIKLAERAALMGVELFVIDDGWFGKRYSDNAGLGDWFVNTDKFPDGLTPLIKKVNELGMDFGIWVEPEMVNPDSDLYRAHPDWVYHFETRTCTPARKQLVLDMTRPEVQDYLFKVLDDILTNNNVKFLKWDMNRPISEPGALALERHDRKSLWHRNSLAVMELADKLRKCHPEVVFEACASGGGRVDFGALSHFDQFWTSDNTESPDRLYIQEGYSLIYPIKAMRAWVTDCPYWISKKQIPLEFRFHVNMAGALGIGGNLSKWTEEMLETARKMVAQYKEFRQIVQEGDLYRLKTLRKDAFHALQYVNDTQTESVAFAYNLGVKLHGTVFTLKLKGLNPDVNYQVAYEDLSFIKSGAYLMNRGLELNLAGDYVSKIIQLKQV